MPNVNPQTLEDDPNGIDPSQLPEGGYTMVQPAQPSAMDKLAASPIGRTVSAVGNAADAALHPVQTATKYAGPYVEKGFDWLTGNAFNEASAATPPAASTQGSLPVAEQLPQEAKQQAPPPPVMPLHPHQEAALKEIGNRHGDQFTPDGLINDQMIMNDKAMLQLNDQQRALAKRAIDDANDNTRVINAIGAKLAKDAAGDEYWKDASTFNKVLRVVGGILTLGGSEKYINAAIQRKVDQDLRDMKSEDNVFQAMREAGKSRNEALAIDYSKQANTYIMGLDIIAQRFPSPAVRAKVEAMKAGIMKEASTAYLKLYDEQNKNNLEQQKIGLDRERLGIEKSKASQPGMDRIVRDTNGNIIGQADTADQRKEVQAQLSAYQALVRTGKKVNEYGWGDKFGSESRAKARSLRAEIMNEINDFRNAKPSQENSRTADLLEQMIPDPNDLLTTPDAFKAGYNQAKTFLGGRLTANELQAGIK